jgi:hypothetical protein
MLEKIDNKHTLPGPSLTIDFSLSSVGMVEDFLDPQRSPVPQLQQQQRAFRESCQNCADSKVRCSKTKSTCARCAHRGTPCVYQQSKRVGRKLTSAGQAKRARRAATEVLNDVSPTDTWAANVDSNSLLLSPPGSEPVSTVVVAKAPPVRARHDQRIH